MKFEIKPLNNGYKAIKIGSKWGVMNKKDEMITPIKYSTVGQFECGYARFTNKDEWGYIDENGKEYTSFKDKTSIIMKIDLNNLKDLEK